MANDRTNEILQKCFSKSTAEMLSEIIGLTEALEEARDNGAQALMDAAYELEGVLPLYPLEVGDSLRFGIAHLRSKAARYRSALQTEIASPND